MEIVNLLNFLNNIKTLDTLSYSAFQEDFVDLLDIINEDAQFTQRIDLGVAFIHQRTLNQYTIVDGLGRFLSLSLLLHAICECYKKTSDKNEKAIKTIRNKYLFDNSKFKLKLPPNEQEIYEKIILGERLSGKEKESAIFKLLHKYWQRIKEEKLQAGKILSMLKKLNIVLVETNDVDLRELYYSLNKNKPSLNQIALIQDYLKSIGLDTEWNKLQKIFNNNKNDLKTFFKDFFTTKFEFQNFDESKFYEHFVNYFETMLQYISEDVLINKIIKSAKLYNNIVNVNLPTENLKKALIQIKIHNGEDTYAYLLNIYEDYVDNNITEATFYEILLTVDEYLKNRIKTPNNVTFNELIQYLNAFITCK